MCLRRFLIVLLYADIRHEFVPKVSIPPGEFLRVFSFMQQESKPTVRPDTVSVPSDPSAVPVVLDVCMTATVGTEIVPPSSELLEEDNERVIAMLLLQLT